MAHEDAAEAATPSWSRRNRTSSAATPGRHRWRCPGRTWDRSCPGPTTVSTTPGARGASAARRPEARRSRRAATRVARSTRCSATRRAATPKPTMPGTFGVPLRRPRSWPPPRTRGEKGVPSLTTRAPTPLGPPILWALSETRAARAAVAGRSSHGAAWTASVCRTASGATRSRTSASSSRGWTVPTSLLARATDTTVVGVGVPATAAARTAGSTRPRWSTARGWTEPPRRAAASAPSPTAWWSIGAHEERPGAGPDHAGQGGGVGLGAPRGEHHLARAAPDQRGDGIAGVVDGATGVAGGGVGARRVAVVHPEEREHGLDRLRAHGGAGRVVQVGEGHGVGGHRSTLPAPRPLGEGPAASEAHALR